MCLLIHGKMLMNKASTIIFPHQLFKQSPVLEQKRIVYLFEAPRYFTDFKFHTQKLMFHRATMKAYEAYLLENGFRVEYIEFTNASYLFTRLLSQSEIHYIDPVDMILENELISWAKKNKIKLINYATPAFISSHEWLVEELGNKKNVRLHSFYIKQRKRLNILIDHMGKPIGGKWSYDEANRKPLPENHVIPEPTQFKINHYRTEASEYVKLHFSQNPGDEKTCIYPINHEEAEAWLDDFLHHRLYFFGPYEDAIKIEEPILFHSVLSPLLNTGLLTPEYILTKTLAYAQKNDIPLASLEGFIRQIIGWREFVRGVYIVAHEEQRSRNFFKHFRKLSYTFWLGKTGSEPVDTIIKRVLQTAYSHHIERLMILGNFMLLIETDPHDVYRWFMELYIDAYDWVMVPNIYGMSQYADGGFMITKPYLSSSHYIKRMSNFKEKKWSIVWDALYWHFIYKNQHILRKNPRLSLTISILDRMDSLKLKKYLEIAQHYLKQLDKIT